MSDNMKRILYVYAMTNDSGFAPSVKNGLLSLACCKGGLKGGMRKAAGLDFFKDDTEVWVLGLCGKSLSQNGKMVYNPVYLAKIDNAVEMTEYFSPDNKFAGRNDYRAYKTVNGELESQPENPHTDAYEQQKDINGKYVLLSEHFVYWGEACGESGTEIRALYPAIYKGDGTKSGIENHSRGYLVDRNFIFDIEADLGGFDWFPSNGGCNIISAKAISGEYVYIEENDEEDEHEVCLSCGGKK